MFETIPAKFLDAYIGRRDCLIIDLRDAEDYSKGHIMGAYNIPYETMLKNHIWKKNKVYILYCERGSASLAAAKELDKMGYHVKTVAGGILAYRGNNIIERS